MLQFVQWVNCIVWGVPALILILGIGVYLSVRTRFAQIRLFPKALRMFVDQFRSRNQTAEGISPYRALCTALAATIGTGNLAGVAGAIALGGPGAVFWMWICAVLGMIIKFAEVALSVHYKAKNEHNEIVGGPMYMISNGLGSRWSWLGKVYCFFAVVAAFGAGNATQINAFVGGINSVILSFGGEERVVVNFLIGLISAILIVIMLLGGAKRIGQAAEQIVPFAAVAYLVLSITVLIMNYHRIPASLAMIINGAFSPRAVTGGVVGSMLVSMRIGASRGVFTNEAGMGTAAIAHASANVKNGVQQGLMGIVEVFIDTVVICTMTALVILCSGVDICYGVDNGVELSSDAFVQVLGPWSSVAIAVILCLFAFATVLGWGLYGARCAQYLFGNTDWKKFAFLSGLTVVLGSVVKTGTVWLFSETINGLMVIPNLIAVAALTPKLLKLLKNSPPVE